jgi:hypothetical protein
MGVVSWLLPSNRSTCYNAPSLRLFAPNSLQTYCHIFSSEGCACATCDRSHISPRGSVFMVFTAPTAPSLRPLIPSGPLIGCQSVHRLLWSGAGKNSEDSQCSYIYCPYSVCSFFFRFGGESSSTMFWHLFFRILTEHLIVCFMIAAWWFSWRSCWVFSCYPDKITVLSIGSLFQWCLPVSPYISSRTSVLSGFLVQPCPCLVPDDSLPYAVQEWNGRSSHYRQWPTSSVTIALGPFLWLFTALYGYMPVPMPFLQWSDRYHCGLFFRDLFMHRYRLYPQWGSLLTLQTGLCLF